MNKVLPYLVVAAVISVARAQVLPEAQQLAKSILSTKNIVLLEAHASTPKDGATARDNVIDTSNGKFARRSKGKDPDGEAPGGSTALDGRVLKAILEVAKKYKTISISEIAGGIHAVNSKHYNGVAFDINALDGRRFSDMTDATAVTEGGRLKALCTGLGASKVLGPGDNKAHRSHVHCEW